MLEQLSSLFVQTGFRYIRTSCFSVASSLRWLMRRFTNLRLDRITALLPPMNESPVSVPATTMPWGFPIAQ